MRHLKKPRRQAAESHLIMSHTEVSSTAVISEGESHVPVSPSMKHIAGYQMLERIGVGGFGEVWRAIGPGGFSKAVKILFGNLSGPQADTELRALNRIRDLRHPFLLSIERVEVVDGRVIVVTELADRSLDQRFRELVSSGQRGVVRDELLRDLRDAADALDFMSEEHGLQHLDIKPENILLQGVHAKVGDFGLTKAVGHARHSQINGFTPLYAPPELFEGRPDRGSDQYSLAIVYQTMLTGTPPFNGRTASQLMAQHLKTSPDLSSLLPSDRAVVARALSKNPRTRFASCRQFVEELLKRKPTKTLANRTVSEPTTQVHRSRTSIASTENITSNHSMLHGKAVPLAPVQSLPEDTQFRPTLFIGVGGLGCQSVELLNQRIHEQFPNAALPAVQLLCIDTDNDGISNLKTSRAEKSRTITTISTPLKTTQDYRKQSSEHLTWLSRRWLFNIPRSGRVEGMRPLGRLAIVDHAEKIQTELKNCLTNLVSSESINKSTSETGLSFEVTGVDVCLVGSTSGGTSSGCLLDIAWMVRELASNGRMPPVRVTSMLLHGTSHGRQIADMQDANTVSFLQELQHFSVPGAQRPGLTSRFSDSEISKPFDEITLVHLGDDLSPVDFLEGVSRTAEYLELRTLTSARREMNAWRNPARTKIPESLETNLRSFGISTINADSWEVANREAGQLASAAVSLWSTPSESAAEPTTPEWTTLLNQLGLGNDAVRQVIPGLLDTGRSRRMEEYANNIWQRMSRESAASPNDQIAEIISRDTATRLNTQISVVALAQEIQAEIEGRLPQNLEFVDSYFKHSLDTKIRPATAFQAIRSLISRNDQALAESRRQKNDLQSAFNELCSSHSLRTADQETDVRYSALRSFCRQYCMLLTCQTICQSLIEYHEAMVAVLPKLLDDRSSLLQKRIQVLASQVNGGTVSSAAIPEQMVQAFETYLLKSGRFRISAFLNREIRPNDAATLQSEASNFLLRSMSPNPQFSGDERSPKCRETFPTNAKPGLQHVGGGHRVLAVVPNPSSMESWKSLLQNDFGACVSVCSTRTEDVSVICETEGISIPAAVDALTHMRPHVLELAGRLHSRHDVQW
jgi:serine/threonine protein kinase